MAQAPWNPPQPLPSAGAEAAKGLDRSPFAPIEGPEGSPEEGQPVARQLGGLSLRGLPSSGLCQAWRRISFQAGVYPVESLTLKRSDHLTEGPFLIKPSLAPGWCILRPT